MSDDDDLFGSSSDSGGDTDDLIAAAKAKPIAKKKGRLQKKGSSAKKRKRDPVPDADLESSDDDDEDDGKGLFDDSDDDDDDEKQPAKPLSKRERMEALQAKKRQEMGLSVKKKSKKEKKDGDEKGYDSGDSYDSADYVRTKEDNDFIDVEDDDPDAINELYAEQHFDDERPDGSDDNEDKPKKKKKSASKARSRGPDAVSDNEDDDNPLMAAVRKMKTKKKQVKKVLDLEEEAKIFLNKMEAAAEADEKSMEERKPATRKLAMLTEVMDMVARQDILRILLDFDLLVLFKRWIQPLPNGKLGNITIRQRILEAVSKMQGESGITSNDLKRSAFGKVVMSLYMHRDETPSMKRQLKTLIEQWSRPIFQKSGNLRDLDVRRPQGGLVGIAMAQQQQERAEAKGVTPQDKQQDLHSLIASGTKTSRDLGSNRVQIPYSKGLHYTKAPSSRTGNVMDKRLLSSSAREGRTNLNKRMMEKGRAVSKNQRSANISIEGRPAK